MPTKHDSIEHWRGLEPGQNPLPFMTPIPYQTRGSRYGSCGIRIDGNPAFIDAVLSNLKPLLAGENMATRLEVSRNKVKTGFKELPNAAADAECCYIRRHGRGTAQLHRSGGRKVSKAMRAGMGPRLDFGD